MPGRVLIIGTFDTKADEFAFLRERIIENGCEALAINAGVDGSTDLFPIEVEASIVAAEGGEAIAALRDLGDRGKAISVMSDGAALIARRMFDEGNEPMIMQIIDLGEAVHRVATPLLAISLSSMHDLAGF